MPIKPAILQRALTARRESKSVEFKEKFDPSSAGEWCELIKDLVALANSGGGVVVFGLDNAGNPSGAPLDAIAGLDPADVTSKISKYIGTVDIQFTIVEAEKAQQKLQAFMIEGIAVPCIFERPGTYDAGSGKQKVAFGVGTVYFRHGAKSEPGNNNDIRLSIERQLESVRKAWLKGVRKVARAPVGSEVITVGPSRSGMPISVLGGALHAVKDPTAPRVYLTHDRESASGSLIHEELSGAIFDEINNVLDANSLLAKGRAQFFLGPPIYYRIYAERQYLSRENLKSPLLLSTGLSLYAPSCFWMLKLSASSVGKVLASLYLTPKSPEINALIRIAPLLGLEFCEWLQAKWHSIWKPHPQPPQYYWTFHNLMPGIGKVDPRLLAAHLKKDSLVSLPGEGPIPAKHFLDDDKLATSALSRICMLVFEGNLDLRTTARNLDYLVHGSQICKSGQEISEAIISAVGSQEPRSALEDSVDWEDT